MFGQFVFPKSNHGTIATERSCATHPHDRQFAIFVCFSIVRIAKHNGVFAVAFTIFARTTLAKLDLALGVGARVG